jgi:hypothetical protein
MSGQDPLKGQVFYLSVSVLHLLSPRSELAKNKEDKPESLTTKTKAYTREIHLSASSMVCNDTSSMPSIYVYRMEHKNKLLKKKL